MKKYCGKLKHATHDRAMTAAITSKKGSRRGSNKRGVFGKKTYKGTGAKLRVYYCNTCCAYHWTNFVKGAQHADVKNEDPEC